ncbi:LCP family protein [Phycicoccus sp. MAQZ13P-2]|uniref:LCP family protein n=1 Tax=Phycicoccus mangrovi TaxID=2840470 RepID=UPI001C001203|nr:LCP family protein [Phycicoccus mangrovi]MBT9255968.1 LCP family protein [Phycicoccus mangrovi]MBT9274562.1 LCP family protein [Phycicoccus mangrovi]
MTLLLLTLVLPGTAQLVAGRRAVGRLALRVWLGVLAVLALGGLLALVSRPAVLWLLTRGWLLLLAQVVLVLLAVGWAALFVDAWRLGRPDRLPMGDRRGLLGGLVVLLLVPGLVGWTGVGVGQARGALTSLFGTGEAAAAAHGRYNVLLLGGDSGKGRTGLRPDSIQLASVDAATGRSVLFGFSRETEDIRFRPGSTMARLMPEGWTCGDDCLLNGLYTWGRDHAELFPPGTKDPGLLATKEAVESLSGLDVQYSVMVDLRGFASIINAVGGLDVTVQRRTPIGGNGAPVSGYIEKGEQHLDGYHALWYARSRYGSTNYERMARQRCVTSALVKELNPQTLLLKFGSIAQSTTGLITTDIPQDALADLADVAVKTKQEKITSVNFVPPLIKPWDYDPEVVRSTVAKAIARSEAGPSPKATAAGPRPSAAASATSSPTPTGSTPAVMERPGTDPDADTGDLASVCSAG